MAILGVTHDATGARRKRLPVTIKIAIGEIVNQNGKPRPRRLDHFTFKRKRQVGDKVSWVPAPEIEALFEKDPKEIGVIFASDTVDEIFPSEPIYRTAYGWRCRGALVQIKNDSGIRFEMQATRRTKEHPEGEVWPGEHLFQSGPLKGQPLPKCGNGCPEFRAKKCKYSAYLYFRLEKLPLYGAICRIHTTSPKSIEYVSNGLAEIHEQHGGRLNGIHATLRVSPEFTCYPDEEGEMHPTIIQVLSLEAGSPSERPAQRNEGDASRPAVSSKAPEDFEPCVAVENEQDLAAEIGGEFFADNNEDAEEWEQEGEPLPESAGRMENNEQNARINDLFARLRYNPAQVQMMLGQYAGKLDALEQRLKNAVGVATAPQKSTVTPPREERIQERSAAPTNGHKNGTGQLTLYSPPPTHEQVG